MSTSHILTLLIEDRDRIQAAIDALGEGEPAASTKRPGRPPAAVDPLANAPDWVASKEAALEPAAPKKRKVSAAARRKMAEGQKRRWAAVNAAKTEAATPKK